MGSLQALLHAAIDYAGLFPPASLDIPAAVANYADYRRGGHSWMLGRFVVPVSRLDEFLYAANEHVRVSQDPWRVSAVVGGDVEGDFARVAAFNQTNDGVLIDAVEVKAATPDAVEAVAAGVPGGVRTFIEIPPDAELVTMVKAVAAARLRAKIRTGGVTPDAIPSADDVARFIRSCYAHDVPFKATAGLHHPLRGQYPLTYDDHPPRATMHGFLNVFLVAALCFNGLGAADAPRLLAQQSAQEWSFDDDGAGWESYRVATAEIEKIRRRFLISFGSCSFVEPVDELRRLGLLQ